MNRPATLLAAFAKRALAGLLVNSALLVGLPSNAFAASDSAAGQQAFGQCVGCHSTNPNTNEIGPSLAGVVGRKSGSVPGFNYSPALKNASITWDDATLDKFLQNPASLVRGTTMFINVPSGTDRQNIIAYLKTLTDAPRATP